MSRLEMVTESLTQRKLIDLHGDAERRLNSGPLGLCPVDAAFSFATLCHAQSCGKCVPCRIGLGQLIRILKTILDGKAEPQMLSLLQNTASTIIDSADCVIGYDAARMALDCALGFSDDFMEHIEKGRCLADANIPVPCVQLCPAGVDIPGYIALANKGRYEDAVQLICKDNPFPVACAYICEHPCEEHCRRGMIDNAINIRGLKRYVVDNADELPLPQCAAPTGKKVAVIGGGPGGMSAAYYLTLMGHEVTLYERRKKLGGMLRYGIPAYRFPRELLDRDIQAILKTGVKEKLSTDVGVDISLDEIIASNDSVFVAVGAHTDSKAQVEGENLKGVISAVELLRNIGDDEFPDFTGKTIVVVGGGNVAMDATRTSLRLGAEKVYCVYRRRQVDMTALVEEVEGAVAEGAELVTLKAPARIEDDGNGNAAALWVKTQLPGAIGADGRPRPVDADLPEERIAADIIIIAVGQKVETTIYEKAGFPLEWGTIKAMASGKIFNNGKIFAGGDCVTGPATAIRAIAAGKVAAANIDEFLGFDHKISVDVSIPPAEIKNKPLRGRVNTTEREAGLRIKDFDGIECGMTKEGAEMESTRCLRCDHFGFGAFRGGRMTKW